MRLIFSEHSSTKWLQASLKSNSGPDLIDAQIIYVPDDPVGMSRVQRGLWNEISMLLAPLN